MQASAVMMEDFCIAMQALYDLLSCLPLSLRFALEASNVLHQLGEGFFTGKKIYINCAATLR